MKINHVCINDAYDKQTMLYPDDKIYDEHGDEITLAEIPEALVGDTYITYKTTIEWVPDEDKEWKANDEPTRKGKAYIYSRTVSQVLVVYDEEVDASP